MKTRVGGLGVLALGVLTIGVLADKAQITNQLDFKMSQPFTVANTTLPAGNYIVRPFSGEQVLLEIANASGKPIVNVEAEPAQPDAAQSGTYLVFNRYKSLLALSQIFPGGGNTGYQLVQGHPEKQAAKTEKYLSDALFPAPDGESLGVCRREDIAFKSDASTRRCKEEKRCFTAQEVGRIISAASLSLASLRYKALGASPIDCLA